MSALLFAAGPAAAAPELFVAPAGRDTWPGTRARPFATVERTRDAVRALRRRGVVAPVTVTLRGGTYRLRDTLAFSEPDSGTPNGPTLYRSSPGETAVLSGGAAVRGWDREPNGLLRARLAAGHVRPRVLVWRGRRQELARYPNRDPRDANGGRWAYVDGKLIDMYADSPAAPGDPPFEPGLDFWQRNRPERTRVLRVRPPDARAWAHPEDAEVSIFPRFNWSHYVLRVESRDADGRTLRLAPGCFYEIRPGDRYIVRGPVEELDTPGEWAYDPRSGSLWYWPRRPLGRETVYASQVGDLVRFDRCANVTMRGLTLECANGSGVVVVRSRGIAVEKCTVRNLGDAAGCGISVDESAGIVVRGCDIHDVGFHGIRLAGGDLPMLRRSACVVDNNYIHHVGMVGRGANAVELWGAGHRVSHNLIHDVPHAALQVWGAGHTIEYNRIRHTCLETEDAGAIGGGAIDWLSWQATTVQYNWIQDTIGYGYDQAAGRWRSPYFATALYPDWAASGVRIVGNALIRAPRSCLLLHSGRDNVVENNLLVDGGDTQLQLLGWTTSTGFWRSRVREWTRAYDEARRSPVWRAVPTLADPRAVPLPNGRVMRGNAFRRNIVAYWASTASLLQWDDVPLGHNVSDSNVVWHGGLPIRTGMVTAASVLGPNLLHNPGTEVGRAGALPEGWAWATPASPSSTFAVTSETAHTGTRSLLVRHPPVGEAPAAATSMVAPGPPQPFRPGRAYRFSVWLKGEAPAAQASLQAYSWKPNTHSWTVTRSVALGPTWTRHELTFRLPAPGDAAHRATMDTFWVRIVVPMGVSAVWIDDADLREARVTDEWAAWLAEGMDRHSLVADPLFMDAARDDFRLRPNSPARKLGFAPLPFARMGPYRSPLRATWPIREATGAREALKRR